MIRMIVAMDEKQGIANEQGIPWLGKIPGDSKYYREKIKGADFLYGYGLYKELTKPYEGGTNFVATKDHSEKLRPGFEPVYDALDFVKNFKGDLWSLGGAMLYATTIDFAEEIYVTQLSGDFNCTKFFPPFKDDFELVSSADPITENDITYRFQVWKRKSAYV